MALHEDVTRALEWVSERTAEEVMRHCEEVVSHIERLGRDMWTSGECAEWFLDTDRGVWEVAKDVNGPLFEKLSRASGHVDKSCAELFRKGWLVRVGHFHVSQLSSDRCTIVWRVGVERHRRAHGLSCACRPSCSRGRLSA